MAKSKNTMLPLLQHHSTVPSKVTGVSPSKNPMKTSPHGGSSPPSPTCSYTTTSSVTSTTPRPRLASAELIVPAIENVNSVYYGVDAFSPTLVDFYTVDQKRIIWSSRAHRKMMSTLYAAWHQLPWKQSSVAYWSGSLLISAYTSFLFGVTSEIWYHQDPPSSVQVIVNIPLLIGSLALLVSHLLGYFEVINSCHNLELWLDEYFHGCEPVLERRYVGWFPSRIDFWSATLGIIGSLLYLIARLYVLFTIDDTLQFGVISVSRIETSFIIGYWIPFFFGSFALLLSAYLGHVEVVHRWFSWRLDRLETWVTGLYMLSTLGLFVSSTLQFMDPMDVLFTFTACITPFVVGCVVGISSGILSLVELETIHKRHKHPEYGLLKNMSGYGSTWT